ncbi:MAG TPA: Hpt domain-containing protein [Candidatus Binatia bacterium]|nr:Hpt domain-containing protein [Candidatus Binatia bacterium]
MDVSGVPVDLGRLEEIAGDDQEFIDELLDTFVASTNELMVPLRAGVLSGDADAVQRESHRLKGSSGNIGAETLQARSLELEKLGRAGTTDGAAELLAAIEAEFVRICDFLAERRRA